MNQYAIVPNINISMYRQCFEGWFLPNRTIHDHELVFITGGKGVFIIEGKKYPVKCGMLFYFYPGLIHSGETELIDPMNFFAVHFNFAHVNFTDKIWNIESATSILPLSPVQQMNNYHIITKFFRKINECWNNKLPGYELLSRSLLEQVLYEIFEDMNDRTLNFSARLKMEKLINYIHQSIHTKITLKDLAKLVELTPEYLSKIFKETTGFSVIEFINKVKMDKAKVLLMEGNLKIKEVAEKLGFKDEFYFSRTFKKIEGICPSNYYSYNHIK